MQWKLCDLGSLDDDYNSTALLQVLLNIGITVGALPG